MKANKFFAAAMAALALVGFSSCKDKNDDTKSLELTETSISMKVGETHQLVANVTVETWSTSDEKVATVDKGMVTAVAEGTAIISATAKGTTKTCVVKVTKEGQGGGGTTAAEVKGSQIWPIVLDEATATANESKIVASFAPNEQTKFLYVWDKTYVANTNPTGRGFYGGEGYLAMTVALDWSGCGFCLTADGTDWEPAETLRAAIVANPDDYYLHLAIKSTDNYSHCFYIFGTEQTKFVLGNKANLYDGGIYSDFTRNGEWQEFDIPMTKFATALAKTTCKADVNIFCALSEGVAGAQLNLDAIYFYKK